MKHLLEVIAKALVDQPDKVTVTEKETADFLRTQGAAPVWQCRVVRTHLYNKAGKDFE